MASTHTNHPFKINHDYNNVYFFKIDAQGHSMIVQSNDADAVDKAFDEFENIVYKAMKDAKESASCQLAETWGWQGDGGLCIFYDRAESRARKAALLTADLILQAIEPLNNKLATLNIIGPICVRIAIHKGSFTYKGKANRGSIHSKELNFCCHLEAVAPTNTLAISCDVYDILGRDKDKLYEAEGKYEGRIVYLKSQRPHREFQNEWKNNIRSGSQDSIQLVSDVAVHELGLIGFYSHRNLGAIYTKAIRSAKSIIWVMGTGLGGFHADHHKLIKDKASATKVDIRILVVDPDTKQILIKVGNNSYSLPGWRDYQCNLGAYNSGGVSAIIDMVKTINAQIGRKGEPIKLRYYRALPAFAILRTDSDLFVSPYIFGLHNSKMMTFQVTDGKLFDQCVNHFTKIWDSNELSRDPMPVKIFRK